MLIHSFIMIPTMVLHPSQTCFSITRNHMHDLDQYSVLNLLASLETVVTVRGDLPKNVFQDSAWSSVPSHCTHHTTASAALSSAASDAPFE